MARFVMQVKVTDYTQRKIRAAVSPEGVQSAVKTGAVAVADLLRQHLLQKDANEPNRFVREEGGTRRSHFWKKMAASIQPVIVNPGKKSYTIQIRDRRFNQKVYGGPIRPKKAKALAIPVHRDAYALGPREFSTRTGIRLFILKTQSGQAFLAGAEKGVAPATRTRSRQRNSRKKITFFYMLSFGVNQKPWPDTLPTRQEIQRAFREGLGHHIMQKATK